MQNSDCFRSAPTYHLYDELQKLKISTDQRWIEIYFILRELQDEIMKINEKNTSD